MLSTVAKAKLRKPNSLLAHSRSMPTSIPIDSDAASCTAIIGAGILKASELGSFAETIAVVYDSWDYE